MTKNLGRETMLRCDTALNQSILLEVSPLVDSKPPSELLNVSEKTTRSSPTRWQKYSQQQLSESKQLTLVSEKAFRVCETSQQSTGSGAVLNWKLIQSTAKKYLRPGRRASVLQTEPTSLTSSGVASSGRESSSTRGRVAPCNNRFFKLVQKPCCTVQQAVCWPRIRVSRAQICPGRVFQIGVESRNR